MKKETSNPHICGNQDFWDSLKWAADCGNTDAKKIWKLFHSSDAPEKFYGKYEIYRGRAGYEEDMRILHYPYKDREMTEFDSCFPDRLTVKDFLFSIEPKRHTTEKIATLRSLLACSSRPEFRIYTGFDAVRSVFEQLPYIHGCGLEAIYTEPGNAMASEFLAKIANAQLLVARDPNGQIHGWAILWHGDYEDKRCNYQKYDATVLGKWHHDKTLYATALQHIIKKNHKKWCIDFFTTQHGSRGIMCQLHNEIPPVRTYDLDGGNIVFSTKLNIDMTYKGGLPRADFMSYVVGYRDKIYLVTSQEGRLHEWATSFNAGSFGSWSRHAWCTCPKCHRTATEHILCEECLKEKPSTTLFGKVFQTKMRKHKMYGYLPEFFWDEKGKFEDWGEVVLFKNRLFLSKDELLKIYSQGEKNESES